MKGKNCYRQSNIYTKKPTSRYLFFKLLIEECIIIEMLRRVNMILVIWNVCGKSAIVNEVMDFISNQQTFVNLACFFVYFYFIGGDNNAYSTCNYLHY